MHVGQAQEYIGTTIVRGAMSPNWPSSIKKPVFLVPSAYQDTLRKERLAFETLVTLFSTQKYHPQVKKLRKSLNIGPRPQEDPNTYYVRTFCEHNKLRRALGLPIRRR